MNEELLNKLLEYIDARIAANSEAAANSSDCGLMECIRADGLKTELRALVVSGTEVYQITNERLPYDTTIQPSPH